MAWRLRYSQRAVKSLDALDPAVRNRVLKFLAERVAEQENPRSSGRALKGSALGDLWRYRVGDYRILADVQDTELTILVIDVGHRREVYR